MDKNVLIYVVFLKGDFSFDALFGNLVNDRLPSFQDEEADSTEGHGSGNEFLSNGNFRTDSKSAQGLSAPLFPEVDALLTLFKDSCSELVDLRKQVFKGIYTLSYCQFDVLSWRLNCSILLD